MEVGIFLFHIIGTNMPYYSMLLNVKYWYAAALKTNLCFKKLNGSFLNL